MIVILLRGARLLGLLLLVLLLWRLDWARTIQRLQDVNAGWLALYLALFPVGYLARALRLSHLLLAQGERQPILRLYEFTTEAAFLGAVTPGRFGELSKIALLKVEGVRTTIGLTCSLIERFVDTVFFAALGLVAAGYFAFAIRTDDAAKTTALLAAVLLVGPALAVRLGLVRRLWVAAQRLAARYAIMAGRKSWVDFARSLVSTAGQARTSLAAYSGLALAANLGQIYALSRALLMPASFTDMVFAYALASLVVLLPISVGGLGTREATYVVLLGAVGVGADGAVTFSLLDGTVLPVLALAAMNCPFWLRKLRSRGQHGRGRIGVVNDGA